MGGKGDDRRQMKDMWIESGKAIISTLVLISLGDGTYTPYTPTFIHQRELFPSTARLFVAEKLGEELKGKMDHLVCFLPGVYALSAHHHVCEGQVGCDDEEWLGVARELLQTCVDIYDTPTGLAPEIVQFSMRKREDVDAEHHTALTQHQPLVEEAAQQVEGERTQYFIRRSQVIANQSIGEAEKIPLLADMERAHAEEVGRIQATVSTPPSRWSAPPYVVDGGAKYNLLRPETMESLYVLWWVTEEDRWRAAGWKIFSALVRFARVEGGGYSGINDVTIGEEQRSEERRQWEMRVREWLGSGAGGGGVEGYRFEWSNWNDHMESFFLSETMKYAYLLYGGREAVSLDEWVFNTEAHPLPVRGERREVEVAGYGKRRVQKQAAAVAAEAAAAAAAEQAAAVPVEVKEEVERKEEVREVEANATTGVGEGTGGGVEGAVGSGDGTARGGEIAGGGAEVVVATVDATGAVETQHGEAEHSVPTLLPPPTPTI